MFSAGVGSRSHFFKIAGVGVGFSKMLESESVLKKVGSLSQFFELEQFLGWSRNPKKSSDSTTLHSTVSLLHQQRIYLTIKFHF